ncbi:hypothetical protein CVT24_009196 [Panaeolus cyanescens]|uniref:F-box domain-containing protein n=1 Tax=Panaeolus cyanescens TaxID=181874 RepID=A0A409Y8Q5_9AGAR|nr:hypothetical protein CVT24_009196 [Panaeolus cyanescens]
MSHRNSRSKPSQAMNLIPSTERKGGFQVLDDMVLAEFIVGSRGTLHPTYADFISICQTDLLRDKFLEVFLWEWDWQGAPTAPHIPLHDIYRIINHALDLRPRTRKLAIDAQFLEALHVDQLQTMPTREPSHLKELAIRGADTTTNKAIVRHLLSIVGPDFSNTQLCLGGSWSSPVDFYHALQGPPRQFMGLTKLQVDDITIQHWFFLLRDIKSLQHITVAAMRDSPDYPCNNERHIYNKLMSIDIAAHPQEAINKKVIMRALRPLRCVYLKKLSLANDYLWSRSSINDLLSVNTCFLRELTLNNMAGMTPVILVDFLHQKRGGHNLTKLHINPGSAGIQYFDYSLFPLVEFLADLRAVPDLRSLSFPLHHVAYPGTSRTDLYEPSPLMQVITKRVAMSQLRNITISAPDPRMVKTHLSTHDYGMLMHLKREPGVNVYITDDELDHGGH